MKCCSIGRAPGEKEVPSFFFGGGRSTLPSGQAHGLRPVGFFTSSSPRPRAAGQTPPARQCTLTGGGRPCTPTRGPAGHARRRQGLLLFPRQPAQVGELSSH